MIVGGNHERRNNFSYFNAFFQLPDYDKYKNLYYSWNIGNIHFIALNFDIDDYESPTFK